MKTGSYLCRLGDGCKALANVQIEDRDGSQTRGCLTHAIEALRAVEGGRVVWSRTRVNEYGRKALEVQQAWPARQG